MSGTIQVYVCFVQVSIAQMAQLGDSRVLLTVSGSDSEVSGSEVSSSEVTGSESEVSGSEVTGSLVSRAVFKI